MNTMSGGEVIAKMLAIDGVNTVFGIIDGTYFGFYGSLGKHGIALISPRHETSAAHMAGAYARQTGRLGVCMASNGPGVANVLPGLVVEQAEGNRVLCITSGRRSGLNYPDRGGAYQNFDQSGTIARLAKWSAAVPTFERIPEVVRAALRACWTGRPGVVHVDVPENLMNGPVPQEIAFWRREQYRSTAPKIPSPEALDRAAELLVKAGAPLIHVGSGIVHALAFEELRKVAEILQAPVTTSWGARGALPETHDLCVPMVAVPIVRQARNDADVVLAVGARFGETDFWGKAPYWRKPSEQTLIHVDIDGANLGVHKPADLAVEADAKAFLTALAPRLEARKSEIATEARKKRALGYRMAFFQAAKAHFDMLSDMSVPMFTPHISVACRQVFPDETTFVIDGGNTAVWASGFMQFRKPNTAISTFKFGMLGAGVAYALGAAVADRKRPVCCIIGDGAMGFHPQEIETAVRNALPIVYVVVCDRQWGMVKMTQSLQIDAAKTQANKRLDPEQYINADLGEIAWDKLAESMGAAGFRTGDPKELGAILQKARGAGRCAVVHVDVDPVRHMWAPGLQDFKDMHQEPAG